MEYEVLGQYLDKPKLQSPIKTTESLKKLFPQNNTIVKRF